MENIINWILHQNISSNLSNKTHHQKEKISASRWSFKFCGEIFFQSPRTKNFEIWVMEKIVSIGVLLETPSHWRSPWTSRWRPPDFHLEPHIFFRDPIFSLETPKFSLEIPIFHRRPSNFHWRPHIFDGDPHLFLGDPHICMGTPIFFVFSRLLWIFGALQQESGGLQRDIHGSLQ